MLQRTLSLCHIDPCLLGKGILAHHNGSTSDAIHDKRPGFQSPIQHLCKFKKESTNDFTSHTTNQITKVIIIPYFSGTKTPWDFTSVMKSSLSAQVGHLRWWLPALNA